jgi:hypothetical protein
MNIDDLRLTRMATAVVAQAKTPRQAEFRALLNKLDAAIAVQTPGPLVFELSIPIRTEVTPIGKKGRPRKTVEIVLAPSLNEYAGVAPWMLKLARAELDKRIRERCGHHPACDCGSVRKVELKIVKHRKRTSKVEKLEVFGGRRRIIEVVRHSSREVDELAVDILGGKLVVDRLIWAGVIAGDQRKHIVRVPRWVQCKPGDGKLDVRVYEMNTLAHV